MGVLNTVGWMEGGILIPKRMELWRGVNVFSRFSELEGEFNGIDKGNRL